MAHRRSTEDLGNEEHHGGPRKWEAWCVAETGHDVCHGPFKFFSHFSRLKRTNPPMSLNFKATGSD